MLGLVVRVYALDIEFTVAGERMKLSPEEVEHRLSGVSPGLIQSHAVEVDGILFPVKQALAEVTSLDPLDFNTNQARSIFRRLQFKVVRMH